MTNSADGDFRISSMQKKDCCFFVHGTCSYGINCKFNHPPRDDSHVLQKESIGILYANCTRKRSCKFFHAGSCKYGSYYGFDHSIPNPEPQYNSDGLPMRLGKRVCSFYMNYHCCGYGVGCKFHHPEPNYVVNQSYGYHAFGQSQEYHDRSFGSIEGELLSNNYE